MTDLLYIFGFSEPLTLAALLAGIPQLIFPQHQEQVLRATALEDLGVARMITHPNSQNLKEALALLPNLSQKARIQAQQLSRWNRNYWADAVCSCLNTYLWRNKTKAEG